MKRGRIRSSLGMDASITFGSRNGQSIWAQGESEGMLEPRITLQVAGAPWLAIHCNVEQSNLGPIQSVSMDEWKIVDCENGRVLGVCNFRTARDQLLHFYDWFRSQVKNEAGEVIGELRGILRFPRLIPFIAYCSEKRFRVLRSGRQLAVVARPPRVLERLNPFRIKMLSHRLQIRFEPNLSEEDRLFVYGLCLIGTRTPV
ncbi:MAG: hypothetical protein ACPGKS_01825 [Coraliomargarita sp.]